MGQTSSELAASNSEEPMTLARMTITRKFTALLVIGIVLVHAVGAAIQIERETHLVQRDIAKHERLLGQALSRAVERAWRAHGKEEALELIEHAARAQGGVSVRWVWLDPDDPGALLGLESSGDPATVPAPVLVRQPGADGQFHTYVPVSVPDGRRGAIEISESLSDEYHYIRQTVLAASMSALVLVVASALLAWFLGARLIGRPIATLVNQARRVGAGDLTGRLSLQREDEIGQLAFEMDRMCDGLEDARARVAAEAQARVVALEQLRHADRLTTVGTLASGVAHELGTPLNVIAGHAQLIREEGGTESESAIESLNVISRQCTRMTQIIRNLLDFSRRGRPSRATSDLCAVAQETLNMVEPLARANKVEIEFQPADGAAVGQIAFEPMQQVLTNVVLNGLHAMPRGGTLSVSVSRRAAGPDAEGAYLRIDVRDSGQGMDQETCKRVFEPFFTTKEVGEGTGLGLSVAHGIVEDHRGRIDVQSQRGQGSVFSILIPESTS